MRIAISVLHGTVAFSIARRARLVQVGSPRTLLASLPALVASGLAFRLSAPLSEWSPASQAVFIAGTLLAVYSFLMLGDCFAVLPALRGVVSRGPYRLVRHPAYVGELFMILACVSSSPTGASVAILLTALPLVALRIQAEERLLERTDAYRSYISNVPFRLVPGIW